MPSIRAQSFLKSFGPRMHPLELESLLIRTVCDVQRTINWDALMEVMQELQPLETTGDTAEFIELERQYKREQKKCGRAELDLEVAQRRISQVEKELEQFKRN